MKNILVGFLALALWTSPIWGVIVIGSVFGAKAVCGICFSLLTILMVGYVLNLCYHIGARINKKG